MRCNRSIDFTSPEGKRYKLNDKTATLLVRPRGWHLNEKHVLVDGRPMSGSLFDFGLYFFHNAKKLMARGTGPYFYLPKLESHLEARLWNDVFNCRAGRARRAARHHPRHGADRDHPRRPSRWTRSSTSCATTRPGSTAAAGITFSASSRNSAITRTSCCRIAPK